MGIEFIYQACSCFKRRRWMENVKALPSSCLSVAWFESKAANLMRIRHIRRLRKINHCCRFVLTGVNICEHTYMQYTMIFHNFMVKFYFYSKYRLRPPTVLTRSYIVLSCTMYTLVNQSFASHYVNVSLLITFSQKTSVFT